MILPEAFGFASVIGALWALAVSAVMYLQILVSKNHLKHKLTYRNLLPIHQLLFPVSRLRGQKKAADYFMLASLFFFTILEVWFRHKHS